MELPPRALLDTATQLAANKEGDFWSAFTKATTNFGMVNFCKVTHRVDETGLALSNRTAEAAVKSRKAETERPRCSNKRGEGYEAIRLWQ